jgi:M6 family metalloprotease-like protein
MRIRRSLTSGLLISLAIAVVPVAAVSAPKVTPGSTCKVLKQKVVYQNKTYTCIKSGKRLFWNKGVAGVKPRSMPAPTTSATPNLSVSALSEYKSPEECKLPVDGSGNAQANQSHGKRDFFQPDLSKPLRILVFSVDFPDLPSPSNQSPVRILQGMTEDFSAFYKAQSNGKLKFDWTITPNFARLNNSIASYGVGRSNPTPNSADYWKLNFDLQDLAMKSFKREDFDVFIAVSPVGTSEDLIAQSPAFVPRSREADGNRYWAGNWLGGDYWRDGQKWFYPAHEFGHYVLGLDDLGQMSPDGRSSLRPLGHYDIMNSQAGPEYTAWNRWIGGLISDDQILCLPNSKTVSMLKPIQEVNDLVKGLVVPISKDKVIVIENRAAMGYDAQLPQTSVGVIAYSVDVSILRGGGPMKLIRKPASLIDTWYQQRGGLITPRIDALKVGESLSYQGVQVKVIGRNGNDMYVEVTRES